MGCRWVQEGVRGGGGGHGGGGGGGVGVEWRREMRGGNFDGGGAEIARRALACFAFGEVDVTWRGELADLHDTWHRANVSCGSVYVTLFCSTPCWPVASLFMVSATLVHVLQVQPHKTVSSKSFTGSTAHHSVFRCLHNMR